MAASVLALPVHKIPAENLLQRCDAAARAIAAHADAMDRDFTLPLDDIALLHDAGLLVAPFPSRLGGAEIARGAGAVCMLGPVLRRLARASLPIARLYEGHVNAVGLVIAYGSDAQAGRMAEEAWRGALFGVWAADGDQALKLRGAAARRVLEGRKIFCSGAGIVTRPLVTARDEAGRVWMAIPRMDQGERVDLSGWRAQGMRASATGIVDFTGIELAPDDIVGEADCYHRQPLFSGGAWRFAAAHLGGMEALCDLLRDHLNDTKRGADPQQAARFGEAVIAVETARLWVERAAELAETSRQGPDAIATYVNLARCAVERSALDLLQLVQRSVGLAAFLRPNPIERIARDLATYLRQPGPDRALSEGARWALGQEGAGGMSWD